MIACVSRCLPFRGQALRFRQWGKKKPPASEHLEARYGASLRHSELEDDLFSDDGGSSGAHQPARVELPPATSPSKSASKVSGVPVSPSMMELEFNSLGIRPAALPPAEPESPGEEDSRSGLSLQSSCPPSVAVPQQARNEEVCVLRIPGPGAKGSPGSSTSAAEYEEAAGSLGCQCAICCDELSGRQVCALLDERGARACRHYFHQSCVRSMERYYAARDEETSVGRKKSCPLCRTAYHRAVPLPPVAKDPEGWFRLAAAAEAPGAALVLRSDPGEVALTPSGLLEALRATLPIHEGNLAQAWDSLWSEWTMVPGAKRISLVTFLDEECHQAENREGLRSWLLRNSARICKDTEGRSEPCEELIPDLRKEPEAWFEYWDVDGAGTLEVEDLIIALLRTFEKGPDSAFKGLSIDATVLRCLVSDFLGGTSNSGGTTLEAEQFTMPEFGLLDFILTNLGPAYGR